MQADRPKEIKRITLCVWVYVAANISEGSVISFGQKLQLKIYYGNSKKFIVNLYNWNR